MSVAMFLRCMSKNEYDMVLYARFIFFVERIQRVKKDFHHWHLFIC